MGSPAHRPRPVRRFAWWLVAAPAALAAISGLYLIAGDVDGAEFEAATGASYASMAAEEQGVIDHIQHLERLVGISMAAFALLAALGALVHHRRPDPALWATLWVFPAGLAGIAVALATQGATGLTAYYVGLAILAGIGLALARTRAASRDTPSGASGSGAE